MKLYNVYQKYYSLAVKDTVTVYQIAAKQIGDNGSEKTAIYNYLNSIGYQNSVNGNLELLLTTGNIICKEILMSGVKQGVLTEKSNAKIQQGFYTSLFSTVNFKGYGKFTWYNFINENATAFMACVLAASSMELLNNFKTGNGKSYLLAPIAAIEQLNKKNRAEGIEPVTTVKVATWIGTNWDKVSKAAEIALKYGSSFTEFFSKMFGTTSEAKDTVFDNLEGWRVTVEKSVAIGCYEKFKREHLGYMPEQIRVLALIEFGMSFPSQTNYNGHKHLELRWQQRPSGLSPENCAREKYMIPDVFDVFASQGGTLTEAQFAYACLKGTLIGFKGTGTTSGKSSNFLVRFFKFIFGKSETTSENFTGKTLNKLLASKRQRLPHGYQLVRRARKVK